MSPINSKVLYCSKSFIFEILHCFQPHLSKPKQLTPSERQAMFGNILEDMQGGGSATTAYNGTFQAQGPVDAINGALPEGNVGLDQIMALMNGK